MLAEVTTDSASILFCEHLVPCDTPSAWCAPACCKRTQRAAEAIMGNRQGQWEVHTAESQGEQEVQVLEGLLEPRPRARPWGRCEEQQPRPCPAGVTAPLITVCVGKQIQSGKQSGSHGLSGQTAFVVGDSL